MNKITKSKITGYAFRIVSVTSFGISPIIAKYCLPDFDGITITSLSFLAAFTFIIPVIIYKVLKRDFGYKTSYSKWFWIAIFSDIFFYCTLFLSVQLTSASNANLFLNFAPVAGIIFALLFLRESIPYLVNKDDIIKVLITFLLGAAGASILFINKEGMAHGKAAGDFFALLMMLLDVAFTLAIIMYVKTESAFTGFNYIIRRVIISAMFFSPFAFNFLVNHFISFKEIIGILFLGIIHSIFGVWCAYEAFRRLDGFVSYLMLNFAALITIVIEIYFFSLPVNFFLVSGAGLIIFSSVSAEYINTKSEKSFLMNKG